MVIFINIPPFPCRFYIRFRVECASFAVSAQFSLGTLAGWSWMVLENTRPGSAVYETQN